ncbi:MAG TPA: hypothetical protein VJC03_06460, partial [bacterium]|nr:hypothetical protein [bacterium]
IELNPVRAGISAAPEDYPWSSYHYYGEGKRDGLITAANPEYERFSEDMQSRIDIYREYLKGRMNDRRKLERYFKNGVYGSELFESQMRDKGLIPVWSHAGRPKKKNN